MSRQVSAGEGVPSVFYRNAIDLNRFSNGIARKIARENIFVIIKASKQLQKIDESKGPSYKAARLRSLIKQTKNSLSKWQEESVDTLIKDLEGVANLQAGFVEGQIKKALPSAMQEKIHDRLGYSVQSVAVSPSFAKAVVTNEPTDISFASAARSQQRKAGAGVFNLTAKQGAELTLPNGDTVKKAFRGLASQQSNRFNQIVRTGLLSGEPTQDIARQLVGTLDFGEKAKTLKKLGQAGGEATKIATHQISTIVRTSVSQVSNAASQNVYKANQEVTEEYRYVSTLDSRTSAVCRNLDGQVFKYNEGPTPPQHFGCRSTTVAVINYKKWGFSPPPAGKRASVDGPVPANTTYGKWLYDKRKPGTKFTPGPEQIKVLGTQKAKYFNRLSNKYGPDEAMKKFMREDNSETSLATLQKRYGKPENIKAKAIKKKAAALKIPVETLSTTKATTDTWSPTSDFKEGIKRGESMTKNRFKKTNGLSAKYKKAFTEYQEAQEDYFTYRFDNVYTKGVTYDEAAQIYKKENIAKKAKWLSKKETMLKIEQQGAKEMAVLRKELLKTNVSDTAIKESLDKIPFANKTKELQLGVRKDIEEFAKMFNGGGVTIKPERLSSGGQITKVKLGTSRAYNSLGEILVPFGDPTNVAKTLKAKQTIFHEVGHSLEKITNKNLDMSVGWRTSRVTSNIPTKAKTKVKRAWTLKEKVLPDEFIEPYVGRPYYQFGVDRATEVVSMGVEHFATPELMFRLYTIDPDHFHMVLSLTRNVY